jgi:hypothetical protein
VPCSGSCCRWGEPGHKEGGHSCPPANDMPG